MKLAYLGPKGTFSHQAARYWAGQQPHILAAYPTVMATLLAVVKGEVDAAVVPVENSIEGSVNLTMDFLAKEHLQSVTQSGESRPAVYLKIQGELVLDILHCLVAKEADEPLGIIVSHPQALAQCRGYLESRFPNARLEQAESTAHAARLVAQRGRGWGAVCSAYAAAVNNLVVRERGIADISPNQTRFFLVGTTEAKPTGHDKTSLMLALPQDKPGGLHSILWEFAKEDINLTRIESRPSKKELGDYIFFIDCRGHYQVPPLDRVLKLLKEKTVLLHVLGSYPAFSTGSDQHE